jgi:serine protease AprX
MLSHKRSHALRKLMSLTLVATLCCAGILVQGAPAELKSDKVSPDLREHMKRSGRVEVIVQLNAATSGRLNGFLTRGGIRLKGRFAALGAMALDLPKSMVDELASFPEVESVTRDREVARAGHVTATTGADAVRTLPSAKGGTTTLDGAGVGIAVLDSGVYADHLALKDAGGGRRTVFAKDFTGENSTEDPYGHGSHVASTAAGNDKLSGQSGSFAGVAPNATLVNLRVLDANGQGRVSWVLDALNWVKTYGHKYRIRIVNLSLGAPAVDSYRIDPLCKAVRALVDSGLVVVAAAGNDGKLSDTRLGPEGTKVYGLIHAPGNEPSAITVGASNTFGTNDRRDDTVTSFSSRGPTRSSWTDESGAKHYDNLVKPDLVAPGNKVVYAEALDNHLVRNNGHLHVTPNESNGVGAANKRMMYMSGTSVSAPVVAGATALLLQANPSLTPNLVKMILMYTAQPLAGFNQLEQGAGQLNIEGAVRLARLVRTDLAIKARVGDPLLTAAAPAPQSTVEGYSFHWGRGITVNHAFLIGDALATRYQKVYAKGFLLGDAVTEGYDTQAVNTSLMSNGIVISDGIVMGDGTAWGGESIFQPWGIVICDGIVISDGIVMGDGIVISDGIVMSDAAAGMSVVVHGEDTPHMR